MPIYEFKCSKCDEVFEVLVPRPSDATEPCPQCGSADTEKLLSVTSSIISQGDPFAGCPMPGPGMGKACPAAPGCARPGARRPSSRGGFGGGMGGGCPMPPIN